MRWLERNCLHFNWEVGGVFFSDPPKSGLESIASLLQIEHLKSDIFDKKWLGFCDTFVTQFRLEISREHPAFSKSDTFRKWHFCDTFSIAKVTLLKRTRDLDSIDFQLTRNLQLNWLSIETHARETLQLWLNCLLGKFHFLKTLLDWTHEQSESRLAIAIDCVSDAHTILIHRQADYLITR